MKSFTLKEKSWMLYDWANSAFALTILSTILPIYFTNMVNDAGLSKEIATSYWGYTNSFASLVVAFLAPMMGGLADYMGFKKKFFTFFTLLGVISTAFMAIIPYGQWMALMIIYIFAILGFSLGNVFYDSFITDICPDERMDHVSSMGYALGYIGSTIPFILCMILITLSQKQILPLSVVSVTKISFVITALWWIVFTLPMLKNVNQVHGKEPKKIEIMEPFRELFYSFKKIKNNRRAMIFLLAYFFYIDGVDTIIRMATSFGTTIGIDSNTLLLILLVTQFIAFPSAIIFGKLSVKIGARKMLMFGLCVYIFICCFAFFMTNSTQFWVLSILVGTSQGGVQAISRSYFAKMIPKENSNEYFGFYNIFGKFAAIIGPFLVGIITQITGNVRNGVMSLVLLFLIGGWLLYKTKEDNKAI